MTNEPDEGSELHSVDMAAHSGLGLCLSGVS